MTKTFDVSEGKQILYKGAERKVCPDCVGHKQKKAGEWDCKNLFEKGCKVVGQCCCYSEVHEEVG